MSTREEKRNLETIPVGPLGLIPLPSCREIGDKIDAGDKSTVEAEINNVKEALKGTDTEAIKASVEKLQQAFYKIAEKIYAQTQQNPGDPAAAGVDPTADNGGADYTVVDDDNN